MSLLGYISYSINCVYVPLATMLSFREVRLRLDNKLWKKQEIEAIIKHEY